MKKILIFLIALIVLSEVKGQVVVPPGYSGRNTRENILASAMNALNIPAGDSAQFKIGQWKRAGLAYVDTTGADSGYYYSGSMQSIRRLLELKDTTTLLATLNDLTALPTGTSKLRTIPYTAFKNPVNPTLKEANTYVVSTYGSDSLGFFNGYPQYMVPNEVRQIVVPTTSEPYKAFPTIVRNPVTGTLVVFFMIGSGHANVTAASYMRSVDNGKTWSRPDTLAIRENGSNYYNGASISRKSDGRFYTLIENGIGNLLGLSARISDIKASTNDGVTFVDAGTLDGTSIFGYRMTTQTANILQPSFDTATFLIPVYGLDAIGTNFEAGVIKSNTSISSWTYYPLPQDSSVDKFNESAFYETKDSIFNLVRSEKAAAPFFYRVFWNNSTNTWGTPTAITFNGTPPPFKTMPSPTVLPDGRIMLVIRTNAAIVKGAIWISEDNGLSYTYSGPLYSGNNPFMYASGLVVDNTVYYVYATETLTSPIKCWINLATFSANPSFIYYKDIVRSSIINAQNQPHGLAENWKGFTATDSAIRGPVKPTYIYTDTVGTKAGILFGGDPAVINPNNSLVIGLNHSGHHSSTYSPGNNKGAPSWEPTIGAIDSSIRIAGSVGTGIIDRLGYYWFALANMTGVTYFTRVNPFTRDTVQIPAQTAVEYFGAGSYEDSIYFMPVNSTTLKIININDLSVTNYTMPTSGFYGFNIVGGKGRSIKRGSGNEIFVFDCKTRTHTIVTTPITGSFTTGPFDGRYQWYLPYTSDFFLKQDVSTEEVVMYGQYIKPLAGAAFRTQGVFTGTELWMSDILGNTIAYLNPITQERGILTLPGAGTYPGIMWDGISIYAIPRTGDSLYKIDPKTKRIVGIRLPTDSASAKFYGGFMHNNIGVLYPSKGHTLVRFQPVEFAPDPSQVLWNNVDAVKLNITDTTAKWVSDVYRKIGTDSVFTKKNGVSTFAFKDSTGGGASGLPAVLAIDNTANASINFNDGTEIVLDADALGQAKITGGADSTIAMSTDGGSNYGLLNLGRLSAQRTYYWPDQTGTIALLSDIGSSLAFTSPLVNTGGTVDIGGLTGLGTANQMLGMNSGATAYEYKTFAAGSAGADFTIDHTANTVTFNIPSMTSAGVTRGLLTNTTQTIPGVKTFASLINASGGLFTSGSGVSSNLGAYGGSTPGNLSTTAGFIVEGATGTIARVASLGTTTTTITAGYNYAGIAVGQMPVTRAGSSTTPLIAAQVLRAPTIAGTGGTVTNTATLYIESPPLTTTTDPVKSLWVKSGLTQLDSLQVGANARFTGLTDNAATADSFGVFKDGVLHTRLLPEVSAIAQPDSLQSNQYIPTLANVTNVAGTTAVPVNYTRNGSYVTVSGHASCTVTTGGGTFTTMSMTLPFASNFVNVSDCAAPASAQTSSAITAGYVSTNTSTDVAELNFYSGTGSHNIYFTFTYKIR